MTMSVSIKKSLLASFSAVAFGIFVCHSAFAVNIISNGDNTAIAEGEDIEFLGDDTTGTATVGNGVTIHQTVISGDGVGTLSFTSTGGSGGSTDYIGINNKVGILNITLSGNGTETFGAAVNAVTTNIDGDGNVIFNGTVKGTTMNFTGMDEDMTTVSGSGSIGLVDTKFTNVNFSSGSQDVGIDIYSTNINISNSALVTLTSSKTFGGGLTQSDTSTLDLGLNTLTVSGAYMQSSANTLKTTLNSSISGKLAASGAVDMGNGKLNLTVTDGATLTSGATYDIVSGSSITNASSLTITDNSDAYNFTSSVASNKLTLTVNSASSGATAAEQSANNINTANQTLDNVNDVITDHVSEKKTTGTSASDGSHAGATPTSYQLSDIDLNSKDTLKTLCKTLADSKAIFPGFLTSTEIANIFVDELFPNLDLTAKSWGKEWIMNQIDMGTPLAQIFTEAMQAVASTTNPMYGDYRSYKILNSGILSSLAKYKVPLPAEIKTVSLSGSDSGVSSGSFASQYDVWGQVLGTTADQEFSRGVAGYQSATGGFVVGVDTRLNPPTLVGGALSYAHTFVKGTNNKNHVDSYGLNAYASYDVGRINYQGLGSFTYNSFDSSRQTSDGTVATAQFNGQQYSAKGTVSYQLPLEIKLQVSPFVSGQYTLVVQDSYNEIGSTSNMHVKTDSSHVFETGLGTNLAYPVKYKDIDYTPRASAAWHYDVVADGVTTTSNFSNNTALVTIAKGQRPIKNSFNLGAGLDMFTQGNMTFSVDYSVDLKEDFISQTGILKAKLNF